LRRSTRKVGSITPRTLEAVEKSGQGRAISFEPMLDVPATETLLHWAASSDDVAVLEALLDAGADIESPGSVIGTADRS